MQRLARRRVPPATVFTFGASAAPKRSSGTEVGHSGPRPGLRVSASFPVKQKQPGGLPSCALPHPVAHLPNLAAR